MNNEMLYDGFHKIERITSVVNGKEINREKLHLKSAVAAVLTDVDGKIALVKQYRPVIGQYTYEIPAGVLDKEGKSAFLTMLEEIEEECNITTNGMTINMIMEYYMVLGSSDAKIRLYRAKTFERLETKNVIDNDVEAVFWVTFREFKALVETGEIVDNKTLMAYLVLQQEVKQTEGASV